MRVEPLKCFMKSYLGFFYSQTALSKPRLYELKMDQLMHFSPFYYRYSRLEQTQANKYLTERIRKEKSDFFLGENTRPPAVNKSHRFLCFKAFRVPCPNSPLPFDERETFCAVDKLFTWSIRPLVERPAYCRRPGQTLRATR